MDIFANTSVPSRGGNSPEAGPEGALTEVLHRVIALMAVRLATAAFSLDVDSGPMRFTFSANLQNPQEWRDTSWGFFLGGRTIKLA
jgi:hypothetical protein